MIMKLYHVPYNCGFLFMGGCNQIPSNDLLIVAKENDNGFAHSFLPTHIILSI